MCCCVAATTKKKKKNNNVFTNSAIIRNIQIWYLFLKTIKKKAILTASGTEKTIHNQVCKNVKSNPFLKNPEKKSFSYPQKNVYSQSNDVSKDSWKSIGNNA